MEKVPPTSFVAEAVLFVVLLASFCMVPCMGAAIKVFVSHVCLACLIDYHLGYVVDGASVTTRLTCDVFVVTVAKGGVAERLRSSCNLFVWYDRP